MPVAAAPEARPNWGPPPAIVLLLPVVVSFVIQVPAAIGIAVWSREAPAQAAVQIALAIAGALALLAARRYPGPTVAAVTTLALADLLLGPDTGPPFIALAFAVVAGVARGALVWTGVSLGVGWVAALIVGTWAGLDWHPFRVAVTTAALAVCVSIGWFIRVRRARIAAYRIQAQERRQRAETQERVRIARELHDVIGHALSQIHVQASVGLHLMDRDTEQARTALGNIKDTSKTALEEVRSVLGVIREGEAPLAPQAELAELPRLIAGVRTPGLTVELDDRLTERPGRAVQFAAYRIVQEALTNVVRHADATRAVVTLEHDGSWLQVTIDDDGRGLGARVGSGLDGLVNTEAVASTETDPDHRMGSGVLGMQERAALLGGSIEIGERPGGGTSVVARLPWSRS
jgi:signal transduction histidine kinase